MDRCKEISGKCHIFSTFFYKQLRDIGYKTVRNWTTKKNRFDIFSLDRLIIPIHQDGVHWCCAAVNFGKKRIEFYDSMSGDSEECFKACMVTYHSSNSCFSSRAILCVSGAARVSRRRVKRQEKCTFRFRGLDQRRTFGTDSMSSSRKHQHVVNEWTNLGIH
jgi:Ulp1 family protease